MEKYRLDTLKVSQYKNYPFEIDGKVRNNFKRTGEDTFLGFVANCQSGFWFGDEFWHNLRKSKLNDESRYKLLKSFLPAYTLCAEYSGKREPELLTMYNDLICIDIDPGSNPSINDWPLIRDKFFEAWPEVVLSSLSASGEGVFMVFALQNQNTASYTDIKSNHKRYYEGLERAFKRLDIILDTSCKDVPRLRYATFDPELKYRAIIQKEFKLPPQAPQKAPEPRKYKSIPNTPKDPYVIAVNAANKKFGLFREGVRHDWIRTCTLTLESLGVPKLERDSFINNNIMDLSQINTNCLK